MEQKLAGHCLCGAVHFKAKGEPVSTVNCHCEDCRRATGAVFGTVLYFRKADVEIRGALGTYTHVPDRGTEITKNFCTTCGSQLFTGSSAWPDLIGARAGCITPPADISVERNVFMDTKPLPADAGRFPFGVKLQILKYDIVSHIA